MAPLPHCVGGVCAPGGDPGHAHVCRTPDPCRVVQVWARQLFAACVLPQLSGSRVPSVEQTRIYELPASSSSPCDSSMSLGHSCMRQNMGTQEHGVFIQTPRSKPSDVPAASVLSGSRDQALLSGSRCCGFISQGSLFAFSFDNCDFVSPMMKRW